MGIIDKIKDLLVIDKHEREINKAVEEINPYTDDFFNERLEELKARVDEKRYTHTLGVIDMAQKLAETYNVDVYKARLAAALHDWDKCYTDAQMRKRIVEVGADTMVSTDVIENMPKVLHGYTAGFALGIKYPGIPADVLKAVMYHTTGNIMMGKLDMVVYIADALDPNRKIKECDDLATLIGKVSLEDLFIRVFALSVISVLKKGKTLHPQTGEIWNHHVLKYNKRHKVN